MRAPAASLARSLLLAPLLAGCAHVAPKPLPVQPHYVYKEVAARYRAFFPTTPDHGDPDPERDQGLLRPRFGIPAITQAGAAFEVHLMERGTSPPPRGALLQPGLQLSNAELARCLDAAAVPGCYPLALTPRGREEIDDSGSVAAYAALAAAAPPGPYDLYLGSTVDPPSRAPKAVWLRAASPDEPAALRVAHLSDLHIGKHVSGAADPSAAPGEDLLTTRLRRVLDEVNAAQPDLVVVTGDLVNRGQDEALAPRARDLLLRLTAPVLVVMGNHDIEFDLRKLSPRRYGAGWSNFARAFHPYLHFEVRLGGYDFVGFDSGPSERSARILTRGLSPATLAQLDDDVRDAEARGQRGVVFFSHAPTRASLFSGSPRRSVGIFGRMRRGSAAFEDILLSAATRGQRVLHLAGHTHWSDVFEASALRGHQDFSRWPSADLSACPRAIHGRAALITTQAAAHSGMPFKANARGYGFSVLTLDGGDPTVALHRFGVPAPAITPLCQQG